MSRPAIEIDGGRGEGGGQILRTALALSVITGTPLAIERIRAGRSKPGLLRQHLAAVGAAAAVGRAEVTGDRLGSQALTFAPAGFVGGDHTFRVGSAGSAMLVLHTVLPALAVADAPSTITVEGGTHNPHAPPFEHTARTLGPLLERMGTNLELILDRPGFYPKGGGRVRALVEPRRGLAPLHLIERGELLGVRAKAIVSELPRDIAERELGVARRQLELGADALTVVEVEHPNGPGNVLIIEVESERVTEVFVGFGAKGIRAEVIAKRTVGEVKRYLNADVPVGEHTADQLLLPLALAGGGAFRTLTPTEHATTNAEVIRTFLPEVSIEFDEDADGTCHIDVRREEPTSDSTASEVSDGA